MIEKLPPRERQVFDILYACGEATAAEIHSRISDPPSNSAIRIMLSRLEKKGFVTHRLEDQRYIYAATILRPKVKQTAIRHFIQTFFGGSPIGAATALIGMSEEVDPEELARLEDTIARIRKEQSK